MTWAKMRIAAVGDAGNGMLATEPIEAGEALIRVPGAAMMSTATARAGPLGKLIESDQLLAGMPNVALALHVLCELYRGADSPWGWAARRRPRGVRAESRSAGRTSPRCRSPTRPRCTTRRPRWRRCGGRPRLSRRSRSTRAWRGSTGARPPAQAARCAANTPRSYIFKRFQDADARKAAGLSSKADFTFDDYRWAVSVVMTRQNQVPVSGPPEKPVLGFGLIPIWDMLNHAEG